MTTQSNPLEKKTAYWGVPWEDAYGYAQAVQVGNDTEQWQMVYQGISWRHLPTGQSVATTWAG